MCDRKVNVIGPSAELGTSRQTAAPQDSAAQSEDTKASSQASELPKVTPAAAPAAASAAPASFLEFPAWQQKAVATSTEPPSEGSAAPPLSTQACLFKLENLLSPAAIAGEAFGHQFLRISESALTSLLIELHETATHFKLAVRTSVLAA